MSSPAPARRAAVWRQAAPSRGAELPPVVVDGKAAPAQRSCPEYVAAMLRLSAFQPRSRWPRSLPAPVHLFSTSAPFAPVHFYPDAGPALVLRLCGDEGHWYAGGSSHPWWHSHPPARPRRPAMTTRVAVRSSRTTATPAGCRQTPAVLRPDFVAAVERRPARRPPGWRLPAR
ncbi:hypothetical protein D3C75_808130 [compost metagenome]